MYAYHAAPWSHQYDERNRITHQTRTKQRVNEEWTSWAREKYEWRTSWTWEEVMAGDKSLPWKQVEIAQEVTIRGDTASTEAREAAPQKMFGGEHGQIGRVRG